MLGAETSGLVYFALTGKMFDFPVCVVPLQGLPGTAEGFPVSFRSLSEPRNIH